VASETRFSHLADLVLSARALPGSEREPFLKSACGDDDELYAAALRLAQIPTAEADRLEYYNPLGPSPERPQFAPGTIFGKYRIVDKIADGGMSTVYRAEHIRSHHKVAIKFLSPSGLRFSTREHEILGELSHDNIARLFDSDITDEGIPYLVLEYVEGESLSTYCDTHALSLERRLELFLTICNGIQYAHSIPIVHRDIKPENVLVTADAVPKIVDFGIARSLPRDIRAVTLTHGQLQPMTLAFASPEQVLGQRVGIPSDIYSLGMLVCVLLTGRLPYRVRTAGDLHTAIPTQEPTRPSELVEAPRIENPGGELYYPYLGPAPPDDEPRRLRRRLVGDLDAIVGKALRKEPERRYQTVPEFAADITSFLHERPVAARRGSTRYRAEKFIRRHRIGAALSLAVLLASLIAAVLFIAQYRETVRQRDEARRQTQRAQAVSDFLTGIFERSDPWKTAPESVTARQLLDRAAENIERDRQIDPLSKAAFLDTLGDSYLNLGFPDRAAVLFGTSLSLRQARAGTRDASVGKSLHNLGLVAARQGRYADAKNLYTQALAIERPALGPRHRDIALTLHDLGITLRNLAEYKEAEASIREALQMRRAVVGAEDSVTVSCLSELANIRENLGDRAQAEALYRSALPIAKKTLGADHPVVADTLGNLALLLEEQHRLDEAERFAREELAIDRKRFGENHPRTAASLDMLARVLYRKGQNSAARVLSEQVLAIRTRLLGASHPSVANSLTALGVLSMEDDRFEEAEGYFRKALAIHTANFGLKHPSTATTLKNLASALRHEKQLPEAEHVYRQTLSIHEGLFGEDHPDTVTCKYQLALVLGDEKRYTDAYRLLDESIAGFQKALKPDHPNVARAMKYKASLLVEQHRFAEALPVARQAFTILDSQLAPEDTARESMRVVLAATLVGLHRFAEAEKLLLEALGNLQRSKDASPSAIAGAAKELVSLYDAWGKPEKAAAYRELSAAPSRT